MSDRVAVFNEGRIQQIGSAQDVYERPASEFVAGFVGTSNLLEGEAARRIVGRDGTFAVRPEKLEVQPDLSRPVDDGLLSADGVLTENVYAGATTRLVVDLDVGARLTVLTQNNSRAALEATRGDRVRVAFAAQDCLALTGERGA
ncbi:TOBE domain-containing protein [Solicola gregarius]|uniref:TOBE domain-containing protein n=2 Tax=Solicola gregarius TaxID=2908642 RepID=A0AA46TP01_9ACTN|nr:TOBE domain-containing protein [Solicola gregarius]UYM07898.1 TOBE domain-containing protein [Solicola gregarius]